MIPMSPAFPVPPYTLPYAEVDFMDDTCEACSFYWIGIGVGDYIDF